MSEVKTIIQKLKGTKEAEILLQIEDAYQRISDAQAEWYKKSDFVCPNACGECCRVFEPDLLESEAVYMAAWLIENQSQIAEQVAKGQFPFEREKFCQFWNENAEYHCSIYGARPLICRLFGASSSHSKNGEPVWKPCKFYPTDKLKAHNLPLEHKQYSKEQVESIFGLLPPVMSDCSESVVSINPGNISTELIRDILPKTVQMLMWKICMNS